MSIPVQKFNVGDIVTVRSITGIEKTEVAGAELVNNKWQYELNPMITVDKKLKIGNYRLETNRFGFRFRPALEDEIGIASVLGENEAQQEHIQMTLF